jgi:DmsE family decaheme c-type cytochrome
MRFKRVLAIVGLCLTGLLAPAWSAEKLTGTALCISCHDEDDLPDMRASAHAAVSTDKVRTPTCIGCHGESEAHANKPADVKEVPKPDRTFGKTRAKLSQHSAAERSVVCQSCHDRDSKRTLWTGSQHQTADIACDSCHQVHTNRDKVLRKATQTEVCYSCHKEQRAQMERPSHHPVPEGKMTCSDCHNSHGSAGPKLVKRDSINATCYTCHAEKRGPFVHQHEPVAEDCGNCHNSHGSSVPALLKARPPMLCQQCHTPHVAGGIGAIGGQNGVYGRAAPGQISPLITGLSSGKNVVNLWQGRSCMNCHTQVHGSNNPSATNPTPQLMLR